MKTYKTIAVATVSAASLMFFSGAALAEENKGEHKEKKQKMTPEQRADEMIQHGDKDGDGKLDKSELAAAFQHMKEKRNKPADAAQ
jgi:hypothetical protein